jgi:hypothetical protein
MAGEPYRTALRPRTGRRPRLGACAGDAARGPPPGANSIIRLWDVARGAEIARLDGQRGSVNAADRDSPAASRQSPMRPTRGRRTGCQFMRASASWRGPSQRLKPCKKPYNSTRTYAENWSARYLQGRFFHQRFGTKRNENLSVFYELGLENLHLPAARASGS